MERFIVSRDDAVYEAWPDVALTASGRLVCVFTECKHHGDREGTKLVCVVSDDRGRTWSAKRVIAESPCANQKIDPFWNCARITALRDGRLIVTVDRLRGLPDGRYSHSRAEEQRVFVWISEDGGDNWQGPGETPIVGICPDRVIELRHGEREGRWIVCAHTTAFEEGQLIFHLRCWHSDDGGASWQGPRTVARDAGLKLCEPSVVELADGRLVCIMRENSFAGMDAFKAISHDGGSTWGNLVAVPLSGCHRPIAGTLSSGKTLVTYRYAQGGKGGWGSWQNFFGAFMDTESLASEERKTTRTRIFPIDYDRSPAADGGYSGWVQFPDGEIYAVTYLVDDAPNGHIRGYAFKEDELLLG